MAIELWFLILFTCLLGAVSPGPSLFCVIQSVKDGGRASGCLAAIAHAFGVFLWAAVTLFGLDYLITKNDAFRSGIAILGAIYLILLSFRILADRSKAIEEISVASPKTKLSSARDGFMISLLNPKLAIFFTALFSQFLVYSPTVLEKALMATLAAVVDGLWYALVALCVSYPTFRELLFVHDRKVSIASAFVFIIVAMQVMFNVLT